MSEIQPEVKPKGWQANTAGTFTAQAVSEQGVGVVVTRREVPGVGMCKVLTYEDGTEYIYDEQGRLVLEGGIDIYSEDAV